ncbi:MAG: MerR family transcriptional regulator [Oscillospiraceae bacterium]|nr:MerR family transcriptional regulator [Oscillospiraceae bacterium]
MELQTISQVSKEYGVSVRMLRYYEEEKLIESKRKADYAYRVYDETAIKRLQQIIILRKLQIPVKQIKNILNNPDISSTIDIFRQSINELNEEITALSTIKSILNVLVDIIQDKIGITPQVDLIADTSILPLVESLSFNKYIIKENLSMEELNKANETLNKLTDKKEDDRVKHPQEKIVETFDYHSVKVDIVEWAATIWCGKIGYATNNTGEPDVDKIMSDFQALPQNSQNRTIANGRIEDNWDVCMSVNYLSAEHPNGVMFGFLVGTGQQSDEYDIYKVPAAQYARIHMCDETAKALDCEPWRGGIPPYEWIGEQIAPQIGYKYGNDTLPIFEYYGYYDPAKYSHEFCYLYVPVQKA